MNDLVAQVLFEKSNPEWPTTDGVYADYKDPQRPDFYVKCPKCGHVHGMFPDVATAVKNKVCGACHFERIEKIKNDLEKFGKPKKRKPGQKREVPWPLSVGEAIDDLLNGDDDDDVPINARDYVNQTYDDNWINKALASLSNEISETCVLWKVQPGDYDPEFPDEATHFMAQGTRTKDVFKVWREESVAQAECEDKLAKQIMDSPENFNDSFIRFYFDTDRLKRWLLTGDYDNQHDPDNFDPWNYLEEVYGDSATEEANNIAPIAQDKAYEAAGMMMRSDGWGQHCGARDGRIIHLDGKMCAYQV